MWKNIAEWLELTKTERRVILFLSLVILIGAGLRLFRLSHPEVLQFDYRVSDSTFAAASVVAEDSVVQIIDEQPSKKNGQIDINTATKEQIIELPGVGPVIAERIISLRREQGKIMTIEELRRVKGMSKKKFEKLAPLITVH